MDVGIIGCGTIGGALAKGLFASKRVARIAVTTSKGHFRHPDLPDVIVLGPVNTTALRRDIIYAWKSAQNSINDQTLLANAARQRRHREFGCT